VPASPDHIDRAWISAALATGAGADITNRSGSIPTRSSFAGRSIGSISVERLPAGTSFLGTLARIRVDFEAQPAAPSVTGAAGGSWASFICKLPADDPGSMQVASLLRAYEREAHFYDEISADVGVTVPTCRYLEIEADTGRSVILLDDLSSITRSGDQVAGATDADSDAVVDTMAALHRKWWNVPRGPFPEWMPGIDRGEIHRLAGSIAAAQPAFVNRWADQIDPITIDWLEQIIPQLDSLLAGLAAEGLTMAHADLHLGNTLFRSGAGEHGAILLDWQTAMRTHGMTDFTFFVSTNLTVEDRRRREVDLLGRYCDRLAEHGLRISADQAMALHRKALMWWMAMLSNNLATIQPIDKRGRDLFNAIITRVFTAAVDLEVGRLL